MGAALRLDPDDYQWEPRLKLYVPAPRLPRKFRRHAPPRPKLYESPRLAIGVNSNTTSLDLTGQSTGTKTITKPTGTASTDILTAIWASFEGPTNTDAISAPSGWATIFTSFKSTNVRLWGFWALGSVSNLGFTWTNGGSGGDVACQVTGFTGVDNTTPIDALAASADTNSASATITVKAVTIATNQAWLLIANADVNDGNWSASGFTYVSNGSTLHQRVGLLYNTTPFGTGSTGTTACTDSASATGQELLAFSFALRPAVVVTPTATVWLMKA